MEITPPKAVLFDWDNTLVDSWPVIADSLNHTLKHMGHEPWELHDIKLRVGASIRDIFPRLFGDAWEEARDVYRQAFLDVHMEQLSAIPLAKETLEFLHDNGVYLAIVSNKTGSALRKEVKELGWEKYFSEIVGAMDADRDKPDPAPVHMSLDGSGIMAGADVWFIGDSEVDALCAQNTGCGLIMYGENQHEVNKEKYGNFLFHTPDHQALQAIIREIF